MRLTHAVWEKRNLGVDTMEFEIGISDPIEESMNMITLNEKQYNVVKAPVGNMDLNRALSGNGYLYIESMINIVHDMRKNNVLPAYQRVCDEIGCDVMDDSDLCGLFHELENGLFKTDRIALDPKFSVDIANKRYMNWMKDEIARGAKVYKLVYRNETINFFISRKISDGTYSPFLGGMYGKYTKSGLGVPCIMKPVEIYRSVGAVRLVSNVSTNNPAALKGNLMAGYRINEVKNVFVKHRD